MNWTDFAVIGIIGFFACLGYIRGLLQMVLGFAKLIASIAIAYIFHRPFTDYVLKLFGNPAGKIADFINEMVQSGLRSGGSGSSGLSPEQAEGIIKSIGAPEAVEQTMRSQLSEKIISLTADFSQMIAENIANMFLYAIGFVVLFVLMLIIFSILQKVTKLFTDLPIISTFNKTGGLLLGLAQGVIVVMIAVFALNSVPSIEFARNASLAVESSLIAKHFINFNFIFNMIENVKMPKLPNLSKILNLTN